VGDLDAVCMIFDIQLPGMSGFALREQLAKTRALLPPIIFMTAYDEPEARAQAPPRAPPPS
jgi:CheY-like chemotaxis protein